MSNFSKRDHIKRQQNTYSDFHGPEVNFTFEDGARGLLFNFGMIHKFVTI